MSDPFTDLMNDDSERRRLEGEKPVMPSRVEVALKLFVDLTDSRQWYPCNTDEPLIRACFKEADTFLAVANETKE
jgi:hypothetical protein